MSEKPFWEGKTCKELKGLRVKITWADGDTMTSTLNRFGNPRHCTSLSNAAHPAAPFTPYTEVLSIELLDDSKYERIDDIEDVREGDIFVANDGNKYPIETVDTNRAFERCRVYFSYSGPFWLSNCSFAYALRLKPKLPDHDGLWWDKDNALWSVAISGMDDSKLVALLIGDPESPVTGPVWSGLNSKHVTSQAPFRPAKVVEA